MLSLFDFTIIAFILLGSALISFSLIRTNKFFTNFDFITLKSYRIILSAFMSVFVLFSILFIIYFFKREFHIALFLDALTYLIGGLFVYLTLSIELKTLEKLTKTKKNLEEEIKNKNAINFKLDEQSRSLAKANANMATLYLELEEAKDILTAKEQLLEQRSEELNQTNLDLKNTLDALNAKTIELKEAVKIAESANKAKTVFLANMSHELRTPLNAIIGIGEILLEDVKNDNATNYIEPITRIYNSGKHLLQLINDVLDLSKIESGKMSLIVEDFELKEAINNMVILADHLAKKNNNQLIVNYEIPDTIIKNDPTKFKQMLLNLLSNACKFTQDGKISITVNQTANKQNLLISVADTGIGIPSNRLDSIFEKFNQLSTTTAVKFGGTGLGLALTKRICELMGGEITVQSELNKGSTFTIMIPFNVTEKTEKKRFINHPKVAENDKTDINKILIIEDNKVDANLVENLLKSAGIKEIIKATTGEAGLKAALEHKPLIILLDVFLPGMSGWEVLTAIKNEPSLANTKVILISVLDEKDKGYQLGACGYLIKPIEKQELLHCLTQLSKIE